MILKSLDLQNIRSYDDGSIAFNEGSTLLSGDVGTGKTTILLAIEFALFGLQRGASGASLLRHGADEGSVELRFQLSGEDYTIRRTLKRKKDSVRQDVGYIISDSRKVDLTAMESKHRILELLGYPPEALNKNNALIFRYTVYTPQEEMQSILTGSEDERINVIRKIFGIDRYKRISDNSQMLAKKLRGDIRELRGRISGIDEKKKLNDALVKQVAEIQNSEKETTKSIVPLTESKSKVEAEIKKIDGLLEAYNKKKEQYASLKAEFDTKKSLKDSLKVKIEEEERRHSFCLDEISSIEKSIIPGTLTAEELLKLSSSKETSLKDLEISIATLSRDGDSLESILQKGLCEVCGQKVRDFQEFQKRLDNIKADIFKKTQNSTKINTEIKELRDSLDEIRKNEMISKSLEMKKNRAAEILSNLKKLKIEQEVNINSLKGLVSRINALAAEIKADESAGGLRKTKNELLEKRDDFQKKIHEKERERAVLVQQIEDISSRIKDNNIELSRMEKDKKGAENLSEFENWLSSFFVKLLSSMEKQVMLNIQHEFQLLFKRFFLMLVPDDHIEVSIGRDFAPIITQNGFETEFQYLSGGERTAIALAYRLSLNKVINEMVSSIRTRDLVILDEPTDGFSSQQMDALRDVLSELGINQVIIVSHEPKIEAYVDNILRLEKSSHQSRVL